MNKIIRNADGSLCEQSDNGNMQILSAIDINGAIQELSINMNDIKGMIAPVKCNHCGKIYDLCDGIVIHRFGDCTLYESPCCKVKVDDREYKSFKDFERIDKNIIDQV